MGAEGLPLAVPSGAEGPPVGATASSISERTGDSRRTMLCARKRRRLQEGEPTSKIMSAAATYAGGLPPMWAYSGSEAMARAA